MQRMMFKKRSVERQLSSFYSVLFCPTETYQDNRKHLQHQICTTGIPCNISIRNITSIFESFSNISSWNVLRVSSTIFPAHIKWLSILNNFSRCIMFCTLTRIEKTKFLTLIGQNSKSLLLSEKTSSICNLESRFVNIWYFMNFRSSKNKKLCSCNHPRDEILSADQPKIKLLQKFRFCVLFYNSESCKKFITADG